MSAPRQHAIRVTVVADPMTAQMFPHPATFEPIEFSVTLSEGDALRPAVMAAVEPHIRHWLQETGVPYDAFQPAIEVGEADNGFELGQGFSIDASGRARATYNLADEPYENLVRAFEQQLIPADPHVIQVALRVPRAGVGGAGWDSFEAGVKWFAEWWPTIGGVYGSFVALGKLVKKFRSAAEALLRHREDLEQYGFAPADPVRLAATRRWKVSELAAALNMSREETTELLEGFGFVRDVAGTWRPPANMQSELAMIFVTALTSYDSIERDETALSDRLRAAIEAWAKQNDHG